MKIDREDYLRAKLIVRRYESEQEYLDRYTGKSKCPFCGGTKTTPFVRVFKNQDCKDCDKNGMINNRLLAEMDLHEYIEKLVSP